ncbi:MAG: hypothetical protein FJW37_01730 [Acidobacteria bacterium]|nr:hypothetical protein [Acidobacteriota bacterium]
MTAPAANFTGTGEQGRQSFAKGDSVGLLRPLPNEDVFFYSKNINNSKLVREADPRSRKDCWSAIGAACVLLLALGGMVTPTVGAYLAGYKLEALKEEQRRLLDERAVLELAEARLLNPAVLGQLAKDQNMATPEIGQVVHLNPVRQGAVAARWKGKAGGRGFQRF